MQLRFVEATISGDVRPHGKHLSELESDMRSMGFEDDPVKSWKNEEANLSYLMNMPLSRLTIEEVEKLQNQVQSNRDKLNKVTQTSWQDSWLADLQALEKKRNIRYDTTPSEQLLRLLRREVFFSRLNFIG
ncbi:unnamed protein product [Haemonchus placei]|uniref:DNA topoisomerase (ATP-hydrolyzing) n=1 Tax=Haemonchus placei TaxID=6290 RepID=A0A0N4WRI5_HAEPC|nr:unnamed protein product [Haemonchus placei]